MSGETGADLQFEEVTGRTPRERFDRYVDKYTNRFSLPDGVVLSWLPQQQWALALEKVDEPQLELVAKVVGGLDLSSASSVSGKPTNDKEHLLVCAEAAARMRAIANSAQEESVREEASRLMGEIRKEAYHIIDNQPSNPGRRWLVWTGATALATSLACNILGFAPPTEGTKVPPTESGPDAGETIVAPVGDQLRVTQDMNLDVKLIESGVADGAAIQAQAKAENGLFANPQVVALQFEAESDNGNTVEYQVPFVQVTDATDGGKHGVYAVTSGEKGVYQTHKMTFQKTPDGTELRWGYEEGEYFRIIFQGKINATGTGWEKGADLQFYPTWWTLAQPESEGESVDKPVPITIKNGTGLLSAVRFDLVNVTPTPNAETPEPEATQAVVSPDVQAQIDANPDLQVMIADMEWDGGSQGYVKKDAKGNITEWLNVYQKEKVRVTQVVTVKSPNGYELTVYSGTSLTPEELQFWADHQDILGEPPVNPGVNTDNVPPVGELGQYFSGFYKNTLNSVGVGDQATFTWYSEDGVEHTNTVKTNKVFINTTMPNGYRPGETAPSYLNDKRWTEVFAYDRTQLVNQNFATGLAVNIAAQGDMLVINQLPVATKKLDDVPAIFLNRAVGTAIVTAAHALRDGKVMDVFEMGAYQKEKGSFLTEVKGNEVVNDKVGARIQPDYLFNRP